MARFGWLFSGFITKKRLKRYKRNGGGVAPHSPRAAQLRAARRRRKNVIASASRRGRYMTKRVHPESQGFGRAQSARGQKPKLFKKASASTPKTAEPTKRAKQTKPVEKSVDKGKSGFFKRLLKKGERS